VHSLDELRSFGATLEPAKFFLLVFVVAAAVLLILADDPEVGNRSMTSLGLKTTTVTSIKTTTTSIKEQQ
jgi:hypothetical protein